MFMNYILLHKYKAHFLMSLIPKYYYSVLQLDVKPPLVQLNVLLGFKYVDFFGQVCLPDDRKKVNLRAIYTRSKNLELYLIDTLF